MAVAAGIRPAGGGGSVNAANIAYTPIFASSTGNPATNVKEALEWAENHVGTASIVSSAEMLEAAAPVGAVTPGKHTIATPTLWTAPLGGAPVSVVADQNIDVAHPGSIDSLGELKVIVLGDVDGPLVEGEVQAVGVGILNVNAGPAARDLQVESLSGRLTNVAVGLLGFGGGDFENILGVTTLRMLVAPPAPGSRGVHMDGTLGSVLISNSIAIAPGVAPFVGFEIEATATVVEAFNLTLTALTSAVPDDALVRIDPAANVPTGPLPTSIVGVRVQLCLVRGPGSLFESSGLGATSIEVSSFGHVSGPRGNFIGDVRAETAGGPRIQLDHTGQAGLPLVIPFDNSQNGGAGGTLRTLSPTASFVRHTLLTGTTEGASVNAGGTYTGGDGNYPATQASSSGAGTGAEFIVTLTGGTITAVVSIDERGQDYGTGDTITLAVVGPAETVAAVLDVDSIGWLVRTDGAEGPLTGPASWVADVARSGGAGSSAYGYIERRVAGSGPFAEVPGTRSSIVALTVPTQRISGKAELDDINVSDEWRIVVVNDVGGSALIDVDSYELLVEGQP